MQAYLNRPLLWDFLIVMLIGSVLFFMRPYLCDFLHVPSAESIDKIGASLISIGATLIGFLLTIITVIVTFKKGFDDNDLMSKKSQEQEKIVPDYSTPPSETIFDKKVSKEKQFYGTEMHKRVTGIFIGAAYEVGAVIFILLLIQFDIIPFNRIFVALITLQCLFLVFLSTLRSVNIFRLYLNVHVGNNN